MKRKDWSVDRLRLEARLAYLDGRVKQAKRYNKEVDQIPANEEMTEGYLDGLDPSSPEPSDNRSHSYRHGFRNGRDDRQGQPRASAAALREAADAAEEADRNV